MRRKKLVGHVLSSREKKVNVEGRKGTFWAGATGKTYYKKCVYGFWPATSYIYLYLKLYL